MQNRFYDKMSIALGLPDVASRSQWAPFGRCITPGAMARYIEGGEFYYGLEATFVASVAEEAPKTTGQFYDEGWNAAHDGLPFDSKATRAWRDGWNDYQHADPAHKIRLDGELAAAVRECITPEPQRPALTWATPAKFDPWKGFFTEPADIADWQDTYFPR